MVWKEQKKKNKGEGLSVLIKKKKKKSLGEQDHRKNTLCWGREGEWPDSNRQNLKGGVGLIGDLGKGCEKDSEPTGGVVTAVFLDRGNQKKVRGGEGMSWN